MDSAPKWTWTSDNTDIVGVVKAENGKACEVTAIAPGTATITGTTQNGLTATCQVTVTDAPLPESGTIDETYQVGVGGFVDIVPVLIPEDATTFYEVTSDNPHVAAANLTNGNTGIRVSGVNPGKATITIRGANGLVMTTTVTVGKPTDIQHEKVAYPGYPATCTRPGLTDGVRCSACRYIFEERQEIPVTDHDMTDWEVLREPTATEDGIRTRHCKNCWFSENEPIPATGEPDTPPTDPGTTTDPETPPTDPGTTPDPETPPTDPTPTQPDTPSQTVPMGGQSVGAQVSGGSAGITATEAQIDSMIDSAADTGRVELDVSSEGSVSEVRLPQDIVGAISENDKPTGLAVKTAGGTLELSPAALDTVSGAMTGERDEVTLKVDTIDPRTIPATQKYPIASVLNSAVFVELSAAVVHRDAAGAVTSTERLHELGGEATVSLPFQLAENMQGRRIVACYIADDGSITYFPVRYENGVATFTTTHFSKFGIVESYAAAFSDVDITAWYMLSLERVIERGIMDGVSATSFDPGGLTSRAMTAALLYRLEGRPAVTGSLSFGDVENGSWYADSVNWAASEGVVTGYDSSSFGPADPVTREQLAAMLWRYAGKPVSDRDLSAFPDAASVSSWALPAMRWAVETGLITGRDGSLAPSAPTTRAEAAAILSRYALGVK